MTERDFDTPVEAPTVQPTPAWGAESTQTAPMVAVVLATDFGTRFDPDNPKQLVSVGGRPIVCWSIDAFEHCDRVNGVVIVVSPKVRGEMEMLVDEMGYTKVRVIIDSGDERVDSTTTASNMLATAGIPDNAEILIHDAVRPSVEQFATDGSIDVLDRFTAAIVTYTSTDTVLLTEDLGDLKVIKSAPDCPSTFHAWTP